MTMANERLLKSIQKKLYDVEGLISTPSIETNLTQNNIEVISFLKTIETYILNFNLLKNIKDEGLLELLNEKLTFIINNIEYISACSTKIEASIHFIKKHENTFFKQNGDAFLNEYRNIDTKKEKISNLDTINVTDFFSIKNIQLSNLKEKKEIYIVGENGDGKTLLLQAIAVGLKGTQEDGLKAFRERESIYKIDIANTKECQNNLFAYGALRNNYCQIKEDNTGYLTLFSGEYDLKSPMKWLQYLDYSEKTNKQTIITVTEAKKLLQHLLNSDITIDITPDKVTFTEKGSEVSFEQLSAGYKGVITIICDLIARLSENQTVEKIADFQGIVLIDEIELHLHPKWQYSFMGKLRETFPLIQFIVTTHSPTVILGAREEAIYYKIYKENGEVKISDTIETKNDFLNDIQTEIFGFDVTQERINNPDIKRHSKAKEALLDLINTVEGEKE
jgi:predicted ATPase